MTDEEARQQVIAARKRLESRIAGAIASAGTARWNQSERDLQVSVIMAYVDAYAVSRAQNDPRSVGYEP
jgi:hypothetical protein